MRFFVKEHNIDDVNQKIVLDDVEQVRHISKALRMKPGESIDICLPDRAVFECKILECKSKITAKIISKRDITSGDRTIDLFQGIVKSTKWDYLIQKAVEFGISSVTLVQSMRCVAKYDQNASNKIDRLQKIADSAAQQSFREILPQVKAPIRFDELLDVVPEYDIFLVAYENEELCYLKDFESQIMAAGRIGMFIGPEGGIEQLEIEKLSQCNNVKIITLGKRILRTESAGVYLLAQLNYILE